jgi:DNA-binding MarR family transcriptional regulator
MKPNSPADVLLAFQITSFRRFTRFYVKQIGLMKEGLLGSNYSLTEARILWELANGTEVTASVLCRELDLDAGYLSRMLRIFKRNGLIAQAPAPHDGRQQILSLTSAGRAAFRSLDKRSRNQISQMLAVLSPSERVRIVAAFDTVERLLARDVAAIKAKGRRKRRSRVRS